MIREFEYDFINRYALKTERLIDKVKCGRGAYGAVFELLTLLSKLGIKV